MHPKNWKNTGNFHCVSQSWASSAENIGRNGFRAGRPVGTLRSVAVGRRRRSAIPRARSAISPGVIQSPAGPQLSRIRRRRLRAPPRSPAPAAPGSAMPTGRSRCRPRWPAVPERRPDTPRPMPADRQVGPASTSSQRDRPESTLPRSTVRACQRGSSPRWARGPDGRRAMPTRDEKRAVGTPTARPRCDRPSRPPAPTRWPRGQPCSMAEGDRGASAPRQSMQH
jgi:hypothetical protein